MCVAKGEFGHAIRVWRGTSLHHAPKFPLSLISFFLLMPVTQATYDGVQTQINSIKINN